MNNYIILYLFQVVSWSKVQKFIYFVEKWHLFTFFNGTALYLRPPSDSICACHRILFVLVKLMAYIIGYFFKVMFQKYFKIVVLLIIISFTFLALLKT